MAEEAIEALAIVVEILVEEGSIEEGSELAIALTSLTEGGEDAPLYVTIEDAVQSGKTEGEALELAYEQIAGVSQQAADNWAESMAEQGYEFESAQEAEEADFEDTDPESDPDKGEPDTKSCVDKPEGNECSLQTQSKLSKFFEFMKSAYPFIFPVAITFYILIGQISRWICWLWQKIKGGDPNNCNTQLCSGAKMVVKFIRKYWIYLIISPIILGVAGTIYFKSFTPLVVFSVITGIIISMKTVLGNFLTTILCDVGASTCLVQGKPINC